MHYKPKHTIYYIYYLTPSGEKSKLRSANILFRLANSHQLYKWFSKYGVISIDERKKSGYRISSDRLLELYTLCQKVMITGELHELPPCTPNGLIDFDRIEEAPKWYLRTLKGFIQNMLPHVLELRKDKADQRDIYQDLLWGISKMD